MKEQDWRQREQTRLDAMLCGDTTRLNELLDNDFVYFHASGVRDTKTSYLEKLSTRSLRYLTLNFADLSSHELGEVCVVSGRMKAEVERTGQIGHLDTLFSSVWLKRRNVWSLIVLNSTHPDLPGRIP